ncbi:MAG: hypothetical protein ACTTKL_03045 [Treponema sp.]
MKNKLTKILAVILTAGTFCYADVFFSGFAGAKADITSDKTSSGFDPRLNIQSFFSGQLTLSENILLRGEFSLRTADLIENSIFKSTAAEFQIDEISVLFRRPALNAVNYIAAFMGTYEPIGSDIFLRRYFGIQPVASHLMESWLGLAGSVIYPVFGMGVADVVKFSSQPIATGIYVYFNHEAAESYVFNADARFACAYRFFTFDFATGIGAPLNNKHKDDTFVAIDTVYWRGGMNALIGNNYTTSLFIQAGVSEVPFRKENETFEFNEQKAYILIEPRFRAKGFQMNISAFSLPQETVDKMIFISDTLGANVEVFTDDLYIKNKMFIFGVNAALTFSGKTFMDLKDAASLFDKYTIVTAPYLATGFYSGELRAMLQTRLTDIIDNKIYSAFTLNIGYKTQF